MYHWQEAVVDITVDRHICKDERYEPTNERHQATNEYETNLDKYKKLHQGI